jgi:drug/metabolite transporter (DMT)-like permease
VQRRDLIDLLLLAALWGASFLFLRVGAAEFGPLALALVRCAGAAACLLPLLAWRGETALLLRHWRMLLGVGLTNSGLPFIFIGVAALALPVGLMAIFNATAPMWAALLAWLWLGERLPAWRAAGLAVGFAGVVGLSWGKASFEPGVLGVSTGLAIAACLVTTACYGFGATLVRRVASGLSAPVVAAGSQLGALVLVLPLGLWAWPATPPSALAWAAALALAAVSTGLAYLLYFRLIARVGPARAISVTFLIPLFAALWGFVFLAEVPTLAMVFGCAVILLGTALSTGLIGPRPAAAERLTG